VAGRCRQPGLGASSLPGDVRLVAVGGYSETQPRIASEAVVAHPRQPLWPLEWRWRNRGRWWRLPDGSRGVWVVSTEFNTERHVAVRVVISEDQPVVGATQFSLKLNDARDAETLDERDAYLDRFIEDEVRRIERVHVNVDPHLGAFREQVVVGVAVGDAERVAVETVVGSVFRRLDPRTLLGRDDGR
jgi:hypothetical protein